MQVIYIYIFFFFQKQGLFACLEFFFLKGLGGGGGEGSHTSVTVINKLREEGTGIGILRVIRL